ncbi:MAG TPA: polyprenol monophosphomannose synthase [Candidatus Baltobacteraceae bacterium]
MTEHRSFLVILPTFNERENLSRIVGRVLRASPDADILVIDDSSPDGTADVARDLMRQSDRVILIERPAKMGLGSAYIAGFRESLTNGYRGVCTMDADNSHDPAMLPAMFDALGDADLVIGSRYVRGGNTNQPPGRRVNSAIANLLARTVLDLPIKDCTSGFRLYSTDMLRKVDLNDLRSRGYSMLVELLCEVLDQGGRVTEVPIAFCDRSAGESKIGVHEIWESVRTIARLRRGKFGKIRTRIANELYRMLPMRNKMR